MTRLTYLATAAVLLSGCGISVPNGVYSCVGPPDCPQGFYCWNSDGRCYDTKEPEVVCEPATCDEVITQFATLGVDVECGTLPDGCDGFVECPPCEAGATCGANGQSFLCGCEANTCSSEGAECGTIPAGCGLDEELDCGRCIGGLECQDNRCVCPEGQVCDAPCGGCLDDEVCVQGECCTPLFPCVDNECSPVGGLPDGCGGLVECAPCASGSDCGVSTTGRFECVNDCTCEAQGIECGPAELCGATQFCGGCSDPSAPLCVAGRCGCEDRYEPNGEPKNASAVPCDGACKLGDVHAELEGSLDHAEDFDFYAIQVPHRSDLALRVDVTGLRSTRQILLTYVCPDGSERIEGCSGSSSSFGSSDYCIEDGSNTLRLVQRCYASNGAAATVIVGVSAKDGEFVGPCDTYSLSVSSYYYDDDD